MSAFNKILLKDFQSRSNLEHVILMSNASQDIREDAAEQLAMLQDTNARLINASAGRGMVSEMNNMQEVAVLVCGLHDKIQALESDVKAIEANYDALQSPMPCGHLARYAVNEEDGTQYCAMCNGNALMKAGEEALMFIEYTKGFLKDIQWNGESGGWLACPSCHRTKMQGHLKDCDLIKIVGDK